MKDYPAVFLFQTSMIIFSGFFLIVTSGQISSSTHREEGVDDVGLYGAQRFVPDHYEDLLLLLQVDEVPEPRFLSEPAEEFGNTEPIRTDLTESNRFHVLGCKHSFIHDSEKEFYWKILESS